MTISKYAPLMLALFEVTIPLAFLAVIILVAACTGFFIGRMLLYKQKASLGRLERKMLQIHSKILQLQKELSDIENLQSKILMFSTKENCAESSDEQLTGEARLFKKIGGGKE